MSQLGPITAQDGQRRSQAERERAAQAYRAANTLPGLGVCVGDPLTVRELRKALKSSQIKRVTVPVRLIFGQETQPVTIAKKELLAAFHGDPDWDDFTTEFYVISKTEIEGR